jgi:hypothetical protein
MPASRATTVDQLKKILGKLFTEQGVASGLTFQPNSDDVIISPFSKCGTTWLQQIVHGLRTRGSMDFGEITEVTPWIDAAADLNQDLTAAQVAQPRAFKSHLPFDKVPQGARYICVVRDPMRALISMYKFFEGWLVEPGSIEFEDFAYGVYLARTAPAGYWHHLGSWVEQKDNPRVLLLCYEHLQASFASQLPVIAKFLDIQLDSELEQIVTKQSSLDYMRSHDSQFDDHFLRNQRDPAMGIPLHGSSSKVSSSESATNRPEPSEQLINDMQSRWEREVTPRIGFRNYQELKQWFLDKNGSYVRF